MRKYLTDLSSAQARQIARHDRIVAFPLPPGEDRLLKTGARLARDENRPYHYTLEAEFRDRVQPYLDLLRN